LQYSFIFTIRIVNKISRWFILSIYRQSTLHTIGLSYILTIVQTLLVLLSVLTAVLSLYLLAVLDLWTYLCL